MTDILVSQAQMYGIAAGTMLNVSQAQVFATAIWPADFMHASQAQVVTLVKPSQDVEVSQAWVYALAKGRVFDPTIRAWTFTMDGHDFYGLRLGNEETLIYDLHSQQWYIWGDGDGTLWRVFDATNWQGGAKLGSSYGSMVVVGGDSNGALYFLDPDADEDDSALIGFEDRKPFRREVTGQVLAKGYAANPCYGVELYGSVGQAPTGLTDVTLAYSDDRGTSYKEARTITVPEGELDTRVYWRSLGSFRSPGRLFRIIDNGALKRIDSLTMTEDPNNG